MSKEFTEISLLTGAGGMDKMSFALNIQQEVGGKIIGNKIR